MSRGADRIARHHGWGRGWVGPAMLATVTSLPELSTGVSAVARWCGSMRRTAGTAVAAMLMTGLVLTGLVMRPQGRVLRVTSWGSIALVAAYAINAALLYLTGV